MWIWSYLIWSEAQWVLINDHLRRMWMKVRTHDIDDPDYHDDQVVHLPHGDWLLWFSSLTHLPRPKAATDLILIFLTFVIFHWFFGWFVNFADVPGAVLRNPCVSIWAVMVNDSAVQFSPKSIDETSLMRFIAITVHSVQELAILRCERCFSVTRTLLSIACWAIAASFYLFSIPKSLWLIQAVYLFVVHLFCRLSNHCWNVLIPVLPPFNYHSSIIIITCSAACSIRLKAPEGGSSRSSWAPDRRIVILGEAYSRFYNTIIAFSIFLSQIFRIWKVYSLKGIESSRVLDWTYL